MSLHVFGYCKSSKLVSPSGALQVTAFPSSSSLLTPPSLTQTQGRRRSPTAGPPSSAQPTSSQCGDLGREHPWWPLDPSVSISFLPPSPPEVGDNLRVLDWGTEVLWKGTYRQSDPTPPCTGGKIRSPQRACDVSKVSPGPPFHRKPQGLDSTNPFHT